MGYINKIYKYFTNSDYRFLINRGIGIYRSMPDEEYIKRMFRAKMGYECNLISPQTYNEKLQWLKLYDRKPIYSKMVDKYEAKKYVESIIGKDYIIPTIKVWDSVEDINFDQLPDSFVLKCTHNSHCLVICRNKEELNIPKTKRVLNKGLKENYFYRFREWPYKNVKPRIICEEYLENKDIGELADYKVFTFNGVAKMMFIASDRQNQNIETKFDFYDRDFNHLPFTNGHPNADIPPQKPKELEKMFLFAEILSKDIPHLRVDFYETNGRIYFGELTFFHWSGFTPFKPEEWDHILGSWIDLPNIKNDEFR